MMKSLHIYNVGCAMQWINTKNFLQKLPTFSLCLIYHSVEIKAVCFEIVQTCVCYGCDMSQRHQWKTPSEAGAGLVWDARAPVQPVHHYSGGY